MARFGRSIRSLYPRPHHGQEHEEVDLSGLRSPGAQYRAIRPPQPRPDPLLVTETAYPPAPEPYREDIHYPALARRRYLKPTDYAPDEDAWEYDLGPDEAMFDGRALNVLDRVPRERPLTYEESVRRLDLARKLEREAAGDQNAYAGRGEMPGDLEALEQVPQERDEVFLENAAPAGAGPASAEAGEDSGNGGALDAVANTARTMREGAAYGGLERIVLGQERMEAPTGADAWATMAMEGGPDELSLAEHAFDQHLEDIAAGFRHQEQAFAEPDWGAAALVPSCAGPDLHEPPEPAASLMMPPDPGPM
ncbi:MAG TPA: hypothetical protein PKK06_05685 [Phycisphaerae bacterium]|nr:hypothetical protein [Phycisphaerae bacterium]HNU44750.1 hypothetical protein [Phycisphaerae bacterium]